VCRGGCGLLLLPRSSPERVLASEGGCTSPPKRPPPPSESGRCLHTHDADAGRGGRWWVCKGEQSKTSIQWSIGGGGRALSVKRSSLSAASTVCGTDSVRACGASVEGRGRRRTHLCNILRVRQSHKPRPQIDRQNRSNHTPYKQDGGGAAWIGWLLCARLQPEHSGGRTKPTAAAESLDSLSLAVAPLTWALNLRRNHTHHPHTQIPQAQAHKP
jgi:hypothetical protein